MIRRFMFFLLAMIMLCVCVQARLSPAMDIISSRLEMRRCIAKGTVTAINKQDIDESFGRQVQSINVKSLPDTKCGTLTLSGNAIHTGQRIDRDDFDKIRFVSTGNFSGSAEFAFESDFNETLNVSMSILEEANFAPETGDSDFETAKNVALIKRFSAADPDGDKMYFEIADFPKNGSILLRQDDGMFVYTPSSDYVGRDSFSFIVRDEYGNTSNTSVVKVKVSKPRENIFFDDMKGHWAHNSAIKMASTGLMRGEKKDGMLCFNPDMPMTRGDFLALCLIMTGHEKNVPLVSKTSFADDSMIPHNIKSYAQYAYDLGIISGYSNPDGSVNFESTGGVTKAEAAVIVNKLLSIPENNSGVPAYKDAAAIPVWAGSAITKLAQSGILNGSPDGEIAAHRILTRAEGAEMICNTADYYNSNLS